MARKLEVHYIRDLISFPLNISDLKEIIDISPSLRLNWGKEYVNFHFTTPVEVDIDVDTVLQMFPEKGTIPVGMYPTGGSHTLLGYSETSNSVSIKIYSLEEFCKLSKRAQKLVAMNVSTGRDFSTVSQRQLFQETKVSSYFDYSWIVTRLKRDGLVDTCPSENILRTDERRFTLLQKAGTLNPELDKYIGQTYEVDSLGTFYYSELTQGIIFLSARYYKEVPEKNQNPVISGENESVE